MGAKSAARAELYNKVVPALSGAMVRQPISVRRVFGTGGLSAEARRRGGVHNIDRGYDVWEKLVSLGA